MNVYDGLGPESNRTGDSIMDDFGHLGQDVQFLRDGALMDAQRVMVVAASESRARFNDVGGSGRVSSKAYTLFGKSGLDVQVFDRFSWQSPDGVLNFEVQHVNRSYLPVTGHIEADLVDLE